MFEKFARIFSRRQKQTTFSGADFLDVLRVNTLVKFSADNILKYSYKEKYQFLVCQRVIKVKAPITTVADNALKYFFFTFQRK